MQSRSGVAVNPECLEKFNELKLGKKHKFIIFSLNEKYTEIVVNSVSEETDYDAFLKVLSPRFPISQVSLGVLAKGGD